jgi:hypothetical protein
MKLPTELSFWIVVAVGIVIVVALAIWFGRGFEIGKWYIRVKPAEAKKGTRVSFGEKMKMTGGEIGGDAVAIKKKGGDVASQDIDAFREAELKNTKIHGDLSAFKQEGDEKK